MEITREIINEYIEGFYQPLNPFLQELREKSQGENIPIIRRDTESFLLTLLEMTQAKRILEIGTAVGYSALLFAMASNGAQVTSLEIQERLCKRARENFAAAGLEDRIDLIQGDARETLQDLAREVQNQGQTPVGLPFGPPYDFVFIDGATNHYKEIWDGVIKLVGPGCVIVADNILYKGGTVANEFLDHPRNKTIAKRMREFSDHITTDPNIRTSILPLGDGLSISLILKGQNSIDG